MTEWVRVVGPSHQYVMGVFANYGCGICGEGPHVHPHKYQQNPLTKKDLCVCGYSKQAHVPYTDDVEPKRPAMRLR